jgi:hypothetical protein
VVEVLEKCVGTIDDGHAAGGHMGIDFALHRLPPFRPEPALIRRHGQDRAQLDPAVLLLDDLELGSRLVEMEPLAKIDRERHGSARLNRYEVRLHARQQSSNAAFVTSRRDRARFQPTALAFCGTASSPQVRRGPARPGAARRGPAPARRVEISRR